MIVSLKHFIFKFSVAWCRDWSCMMLIFVTLRLYVQIMFENRMPLKRDFRGGSLMLCPRFLLRPLWRPLDTIVIMRPTPVLMMIIDFLRPSHNLIANAECGCTMLLASSLLCDQILHLRQHGFFKGWTHGLVPHIVFTKGTGQDVRVKFSGPILARLHDQGTTMDQ